MHDHPFSQRSKKTENPMRVEAKGKGVRKFEKEGDRKIWGIQVYREDKFALFYHQIFIPPTKTQSLHPLNQL